METSRKMRGGRPGMMWVRCSYWKWRGWRVSTAGGTTEKWKHSFHKSLSWTMFKSPRQSKSFIRDTVFLFLFLSIPAYLLKKKNLEALRHSYWSHIHFVSQRQQDCWLCQEDTTKVIILSVPHLLSCLFKKKTKKKIFLDSFKPAVVLWCRGSTKA